MNSVDTAGLALLLTVTLFTLSGCSYECTPQCGANRQCCAAYYRTTDSGEPQPDWWGCEASAQSCPPEDVDGTPIFPAKPEEEGQCNAKCEEKWPWETMTLPASTIALIADATYFNKLQSYQQDKKLSNDALCYNVCSEQDDPDLCPRFGVQTDVALGLLRFYGSIRESSETGDQVFPIEEVYAAFNVQPTDTCPRSDVILAGDLVTNSGKSCAPRVSAQGAGFDVGAAITLPATLASQIESYDIGAFFRQRDQSFKLSFDDENLNRVFGGPVTYAANFGPKTALSVLTAQNKVACAAITAAAPTEPDFQATLSLINDHPSIADRLGEIVLAWSRTLQPPDAADGPAVNDGPEGTNAAANISDLFPLTSDFETLRPTHRDELASEFDEILRTSTGAESSAVTPSAYLYLLDLAYCRTVISPGDPSVSHYYPLLEYQNGTYNTAVLPERDRAAGHLLNCLSFDWLVKPEVNASLLSVVTRLTED